MSNIDLSVIIPAYNASLLINRCLDSVFSQKTHYSYNVIVIDDGSTDNTIELIEARKEQDRITLIRQKNSGPATARNQGMHASDAVFCAYLDADDYWFDGYIEKTLDFLYAHQDCVAVTVGQQFRENGVVVNYSPAFIKEDFADQSFKYASNLKTKEPFVLDDFFSFWREWAFIVTGSTVIRREAMVELGGQRNDLRICEDLEFWPLVATYGSWGFIPEVLYVCDGAAIVNQQGWQKYILRFQNVPMYDSWFRRLEARLTPSQLETLKPVLNDVVCGHSRAMISGGEYMRAYRNLKFFYRGGSKKPYPVVIHDIGLLPYLCYAVAWRLYQYIKINKGVIKSRFFK